MKRGNILLIFVIILILTLTIITAQPLIKQLPNILFLEDLPTQTGYGECQTDNDCPKGQICMDEDTIALTIKPKIDFSKLTNTISFIDILAKPLTKIIQGIASDNFITPILNPLLLASGAQSSLMQLALGTTQEKKEGKIFLVYYYTKGKDSPEMREIYNKFKEKGFNLPIIREVETIKEYKSPVVAFYKTDEDGLIREVLKDENNNQVITNNPEQFKELLKEYYYVNIGCEVSSEEEIDTSSFPEPIDVEIEEPTETKPPVESIEPEEPLIESLPPNKPKPQSQDKPKKKICINPDKLTPKIETPLEIPEPIQEPVSLPPPAIPKPKGPIEYTERPVGGREVRAWGSTWVRTEFYPNKGVWNSLNKMKPKPTKRQVYNMLKNSGMKAKIIIEYEPYLYLKTVKKKVLPKVMDGLVKPKDIGLRDEYEPNLKFTEEYDGTIFKSMVNKYTETNYEVKGYFSSTKSIPKYTEIIFMTDACGNPSIEIKINHNIDSKGNLGKGNPIVGIGRILQNGERSPDFKYIIIDEKEKQVFNKMFRGMMLFGDENGEAAITRLYGEHFN